MSWLNQLGKLHFHPCTKQHRRKRIPREIVEEMYKQGITQKTIGSILGTSQPRISQILNRSKKTPE